MVKDVAIQESSNFSRVKNTFFNSVASPAHQGFDSFMAGLESRNAAPESRDRISRDSNARNDRSSQNNRVNQHERSVGNNRSAQDSDNTAEQNVIVGQETSRSSDDQRVRQDEATETEQVTEITQPEDVANDGYAPYVQDEPVPEEVHDDIVYAIAEAVYLPPETVYEQLYSIDVQPEELAEPHGANKYVQAYLEVESPAEVLTIPEYQEAVKQLTEAVSELLVADAKKPTLDMLTKLAGLVTQVDDENQMIITDAASEVAEVVSDTEGESLFEMPVQTEQSEQIVRNSNNRQEGSSNSAVENQSQQVSYEEVAQVVPDTPEVLLNNAQTATATPKVAPAVFAAQAAQVAAINEIAQATRVDSASVMEQILTKVKTVAPENFSELKLTLRPEQLGDVSLRVAVQNGIVTAMFVAENQRIKEIIEQNFDALRDALEEQGIQVADLFVSVDAGDAESQMQQMLKAQQEAMRRLQRASGVVGEGAVETEPEPETIKIDNTVDFSA